MLKGLLVQVADVQRVGDPPPMLDGADPLKLIGAGAIVLVGLALIAWSFRPSRPVTRRALVDAAPSSRPVAVWRRAVDAGTLGSALSGVESVGAERART
jgi:hypothetical protein